MRKNKLFLLLALLLTAATGAWADTVVLGTPETSVTTLSDANGIITLTDASGSTGIQRGSSVYKIPYGDTQYTPMKLSGSRDYTLSFKAGVTINKVTLMAMSNGDAGGTAGGGDGDATSLGNFPARNTTGNCLSVDITNNTGLRFSRQAVAIIVVEYSTTSDPDPATGYTVSMKDGVKDADKWTVKVGEGQAQALPIGGLKGDGTETVTLQYTGRLKVKGVKATSEAAAPSVPDGALSGKFSVSDGKQVYFSKGNLRYASSKWSFFDNQYDYYADYSADAWDHFGWSTSATDYGKNTSTVNSDYSGDFVDWGATMGTGWRMLTSDEWTYLLKTRSASTVGGTENGRCAKAKVNNVRGVILFPDTYTHPDGVTAPVGVNAEDATGWNGNSYTAADWTKMESAGCVFLPAAGYRSGSSVSNAGSVGDYSSATPSNAEKAYELYFSSGSLNTASEGSRRYGLSVRLVSEVTTSGEPAAKEPATVTAAPTGAAVVGVGKTTALVSGGAAEGGTMMYKVTTENTKPASTDGFSDDVPTAQGITASGKVYVWYYVKGDDTHSDSEIAATAIEVPVADIVWDATNATDLYVDGYGSSFVMDGVTLSGNDGEVYAWWDNGLNFSASEIYGYTFTAPTGKKFTKIEMKAVSSDEWNSADLGTGWAFNNPTVTWTGSATSTVKLLTDDVFAGAPVTSIAFYLSE